MQWWDLFGFRPEIHRFISEAENEVRERHMAVDAVSLFNQAKVLEAFRQERITDDYFQSGEGYGYHDRGREKLDALYARVFKGEEALVRPHFVSGTHTLFTCLRGLLRPGERLLAVTGQPYDTLWMAMGEGGLREWGIDFKCIDLLSGEAVATAGEREGETEEKLRALLQEPTRVALIQRSRGYNPLRPSLTVGDITNLIAKIRSYNSGVVIFVDNCYGEFAEKEEPLEAGADLIAGSLIKNPGGGLAPTGGYVVGKAEYINKISSALTAPGLGKELGAFVYNKRLFYQGLFMAPHLVGEALRGVITLAAVMEKAGYRVSPRPEESRGDIVQMILLNNPEELQMFCRAVQESSPVNSHFIPVEGETPGYSDPIFMAGGTFIQGSSSELSADAPLREPYALYVQGGLSYEHFKIAIAAILNTIRN